MWIAPILVLLIPILFGFFQKKLIFINDGTQNAYVLSSINKYQTAGYSPPQIPLDLIEKRRASIDEIILSKEEFIISNPDNMARFAFYKEYLDSGGRLLITEPKENFSSFLDKRNPIRDCLPISGATKENGGQIMIDGKNYSLENHYKLNTKPTADIILSSTNGDNIFVGQKCGKGSVYIFTGSLETKEKSINTPIWNQNKTIFTYIIDTSSGPIASKTFFEDSFKLLAILAILSLIVATIYRFYERTWWKFRIPTWVFIAIILLIAILIGINLFKSGPPALFESGYYWGVVEALKQNIITYKSFPVWSSNIWSGSPNFLAVFPWIYSEAPYILLSLVTKAITAFKIIFIIKFALLGTSGFYLARTLRANNFSAFLAGIFTLTGGMIAVNVLQWGFVEILAATLLTVLLLNCLSSYILSPSARGGSIIAILLSLTFLMQQQIYIFSIIAIFIILAVYIILNRDFKPLLYIPLIAGLHIAMVMTWLLPYLAYKNLLNVAQITGKFDVATALPYSTASYTLALIRQGLGNVQPLNYQAPSLFGWRSVGLFAPTLLGSLSILFAKKNKLILPFFVAGLFLIIYSVGPYLPFNIFAFAFDKVPILRLIRTPARAMILADIIFAALSAVFVSEIIKSTLKIRLFVISFSLLAVVGLVVSHASDNSRYSGVQLRTLRPPKMEELFRHIDAGSKVVSIPPFGWATPGAETESTLFENTSSLFSQALINRTEPLLDKGTSLLGVTADQDALKPSIQPLLKIDEALKAKDKDLLLEQFKSDWRLKYVVVSKKLLGDRLSFVKNSLAGKDLVFENIDYMLFRLPESVSSNIILQETGEAVISVKTGAQNYKVYPYNRIGTFILGESYFPGWVAKDLDGKIQESKRCGMFNCFTLTKLEGQFEIYYAPTAPFAVGWLISGFALIAALLLISVHEKK